MYIAIDDTDSREGMCTTFLLTEIIRRSALDIIGYPSLVRLNPAIKYKTRGNGALVVNLGTGKGESQTIGYFGSKTVKGYKEGEEIPDPDFLMEIARDVIEEYSVMDDPGTNPGIVTSSRRFQPEFYWKAVREEVTIGEAEDFIKSQGGTYARFKNGRGIIGAAASISWPGVNHTYELLAYRFPGDQALEHETRIKIAEESDSIPHTFNNIDRRNGYAAIFPKERTPVLMGIRGFSSEHILDEFSEIISANNIRPERYICFRTNQGTDDHIITDFTAMENRKSYSVSGEVVKKPIAIRGSHYFSSIRASGNTVGISAFEPTKEFREIFRQLLPGDMVHVFGTYMEGNINVEKLEVVTLSSHYVRTNPVCGNCGVRMLNNGSGDYRCRKCKSRKSIPSYSRRDRGLRPGKYDVPVIARRHLSRPYEIEGIEPDLVQEPIAK